GSLPPSNDSESHAGLSHTYSINTQYYKADVGVWVDEIIDPTEWSKGYLEKEAKEVLQVLGAFVFTFKRPVNSDELVRCSILCLLRITLGGLYDGCGMQAKTRD